MLCCEAAAVAVTAVAAAVAIASFAAAESAVKAALMAASKVLRDQGYVLAMFRPIQWTRLRCAAFASV
eukprot:6193048-Pleurochrysis_carterae.AAC.2